MAKRATTAADAESVEQLTAAARSISDAAVALQTQPAVVAVPPPDPDNSDSRSWPQRVEGGAGSETAIRVDTFGHFTVAVDTTASGADSEDGDGQGAGFESLSDSNPDQGVQAGSSMLAPTAHAAVSGDAFAPIAPVAGNLFVDPALNAAAALAGATFMLSGAAPIPYRGHPLLRHYGAEARLDPVPFGAPSIEHGPALLTVDEVTSDAEPAVNDAAESTAAVNDQQRWNRRALLRRMRKPSDEPVTSSVEKTDRRPSGLVAGANPHPASFQAPLPDFLATAALEAEMDAVTTTMAAAGTPVLVSVPAADSRISLRLTSDPDRRVVKGSAPGFGDPY